MSRFDEGIINRIDIGNGEWIELPEVISFEMAERINNEKNGSVETLKEVLVNWNLKNSKGEVEPLTEESLKKLDIRTTTLINRHIAKLFTIPKAQSPTSEKE